MRISANFIFVHIPKTGGTWMREALKTVHLNQFFNTSIVGRLLSHLRVFVPSKYLEQRISPLLFFEYSHHNLNDVPVDFLDNPPYQRGFFTDLILRFLKSIGLWKQPPALGLFLTHTRVSQLPKHLVNGTVDMLVPLSHPLRWHISRYNYYKKRLSNNKHAADICNITGEFTDFNIYLGKQMMQMHNIYYLSYMTYMDKHLNEKVDDFKYPKDVMPWLDRSSTDATIPEHYGLLSWFFVWFLLPNPREVLGLSAQDYDAYITSDEFKREVKRFNFLPTQNLNQSTYEFLLNKGYQEKELSSIKNMPPINTSTEKDEYSLYYNKQHLEKVYNLEKIIFYVMPAYQQNYENILAHFSSSDN